MEQGPGKKKEDQRVRMTKQMLQTAFLALLAEKPVQNITVKELCQQAGVNRSTFYLHYQDIFDILKQMQNEMLQELSLLLQKNPVIVKDSSPKAAQDFIAALFAFVEKNRKMCSILLGPEGDKKFLADIIEMPHEKSVEEYLRLYPGITRVQAELFYSFVAWGFIGLLQFVLSGKILSFQAAAAEAQRIVLGSARYFDGL